MPFSPAALPGQTPPAYLSPTAPDGVGSALAGGAGWPAAEATGAADDAARRSTKSEDGRRRRLEYPPAPQPLPFPVVDNHTHLDFRDGVVEVALGDALDAAAAVGVEAVVQVGCDAESSRWAVKAADADPRVLAAVAIHPNDAARAAERGTLEQELAVIAELASHPRVRAIGETGLDYFRTGEGGRAAQHYSFRRHLDLARRHGIAVQIHDRDAHQDVMRILEEERFDGTVVFHCFSGGLDMARVAKEKGWYLSFGGTATFKNNEELRQALALVGPERLLVETDAPFLTAMPYRGRPNAPYLIPLAVRALAESLGAELGGFCRALRSNTEDVYGSFDR